MADQFFQAIQLGSIAAAEIEYGLQMVNSILRKSFFPQFFINFFHSDLIQFVHGNRDIGHFFRSMDGLCNTTQKFAIVQLNDHTDVQALKNLIDQTDQINFI